MCLWLSTSETEKLRKSQENKLVAYKWLRVESDRTCYAPYMGTEYKRGVIESDRKQKTLTKLEQITGEIHNGIHVFLDLESADVSEWGEVVNNKLFRVYVDLEDLVGVGTRGDAVFTKVVFNGEMV